MKSITIHNLEDPLDRLIRQRARKQGASLNRTIKMLLEESLGIRRKPSADHRGDYMDLFGLWSERDAQEFKAAVKDLDRVDAKDWE